MTVLTVGNDPAGPTVRMQAADVTWVMEWQKANGLRLDLAFNAEGAAPGDPLTSAVLSNRGAFGWINHTWSHPFLGCAAYSSTEPITCTAWPSLNTIKSEINQNLTWATRNKLPNFDPKALVTGEHSGLTNPNMPQALTDTDTGITVIGADNSRTPTPWGIGTAQTLPRHPSSVYYNVATWAELVDEYNTLYVRPGVAAFPAGRCTDTAVTTCRDTPATKQEILDSELAIMMRAMLSNDPRPGYSHQANLAGDQILLEVLGALINRYRSYFASNTPFIKPTMQAASIELGRQSRWREAVASGAVHGWVKDGVVTVTTTTTTTVDVPLTLPSGSTTTGTAVKGKPTSVTFGQTYAGAHSAWTSVQQGATLTANLPA